jgi:CelD/BcsL family acetyltransferase involved in cellulose biosynthesis
MHDRDGAEAADMTPSVPIRPAAIRVEVFRSLEDAEPVWRALEGGAVLTPYQRYDWMAGFAAAGGECGGRFAILALSDDDGPFALLPLVLEAPRLGITRARFIGSCISNSDWPVIDAARAAGLTRNDLLHALRHASRKTGFDLLSLHNQPASWGGVPNPMLQFHHGMAASSLYCGAISPGIGPFREHGLSRKERKNVERGMRRLEEAHGPVVLRRAGDAASLELAHTAFLDQRGRRLGEMGVENVFAEDWFVRFFKNLAAQGFEEARPALAFHALYAGEEIVATCCGAYAGTHYSMYMNSTTKGPAARVSLISVLMALLMDDLLAHGVRSIDMGIGDFEYKRAWTDQHPVFDSVIPLTGRGYLAAPGLAIGQRAKRAIKQSPRLWTAAQNLRQWRHQRRSMRGEG